MDKLPKHLKHIKTEHKARTGPQHSSRDRVIIKFITFKNNVFVVIMYFDIISVTSDKVVPMRS